MEHFINYLLSDDSRGKFFVQLIMCNFPMNLEVPKRLFFLIKKQKFSSWLPRKVSGQAIRSNKSSSA